MHVLEPKPLSALDRAVLVDEGVRRLMIGVSELAVVEYLTTQGVHRLQAYEIAGEAASLAARRKGRKRIVYGCAALALGGIVTLSTFLAAGPGGVYLVTTGAFAYGVFQVGIGITEISRRLT
jgi:hypothetical protein